MSGLIDIPRNMADYPVQELVTLRYSDQDPMQHINNVAITALLESGRTALLREIFRQGAIRSGGMVLANLSIDFLQEISYPGSVTVCGRLCAVGSRSMRSQISIFQGDTCCVVSEGVNVFFDRSTRKSREPSDEVRRALEAYLEN